MRASRSRRASTTCGSHVADQRRAGERIAVAFVVPPLHVERLGACASAFSAVPTVSARGRSSVSFGS